jgi:endo-1,4-beta-mannosidase
MTLTPIHLEGTYLKNRQRRFIAMGAHWVASSGLHWPLEWQPDELRGDFAAMKALGFNAVRIDLFWAWFEPYPGVYNPKAFDQLDEFVRLAHEFEIYLHPCFFIGGETGYYDIPYRHGRHPHADPEMLRLQTNHAYQVALRYKDEPAILAWDLTDEPPFWIVRPPHTSDAMAINWTRLVAGAVRRADPNHLICVGTDQEDLHRGPFRPDNLVDEVDFFSCHQYPIYAMNLFPDAMLSQRMTYAGAFQTTLSCGAGRPVMIHELGASAAQYLPEVIAQYERTSIYSALAAGANGFLLWDVIDASPKAWQRAPYKIVPHETQFGLLTHERTPRPAGLAFQEITRVLAQLDLNGVEPEPASAALVVPFEWSKTEGDYSQMGMENPAAGQYLAHNQENGLVQGLPRHSFDDENLEFMRAQLSAFILLRQSGQKVALLREKQAWQQAPMLFLPSPLTGTECDITHVHTTFWDEVRTYINEGGVVYASVGADAAIPEMEDLFGAKLVDHRPAGEALLKITSPFGGLQPGDTFTFHGDAGNHRLWPATLKVMGGEVIAEDEAGRPVLVVKRHAKGMAVLCAIPFEAMLGATPAAFEGEQPACRLAPACSRHERWRIYQAVAQEAGVAAVMRTNHPLVEAGSLPGKGRGYTVVVNHSAQDVTVELSSKNPMKHVRQVAAGGSLGLTGKQNTWTVTVPAWDGILLAWSQPLEGE